MADQTPQEILAEGTAHFYKCEDVDAVACFKRAAELDPAGWAATYLGTTLCLNFIPGRTDPANFDFIHRAIEVFTEIAVHHPVPEIRENGKRQLDACIYLRDNAPNRIG